MTYDSNLWKIPVYRFTKSAKNTNIHQSFFCTAKFVFRINKKMSKGRLAGMSCARTRTHLASLAQRSEMAVARSTGARLAISCSAFHSWRDP